MISSDVEKQSFSLKMLCNKKDFFVVDFGGTYGLTNDKSLSAKFDNVIDVEKFISEHSQKGGLLSNKILEVIYN